MGLREVLGGLAEEELNKLVDELKPEELVDKLVDLIKPQLAKVLNDEIKAKLKANYIDKLDGEDDIPDVQ